MKQGINKVLALFLAVVLAFSPIAAAFGDSMTVYATEASTESETQRSRSAADLHEALETRAETETKVVQNDNKISDDTGKDDGDTTGSGNSSSNGNSNNAGNSDNGGSKRETPAQEYIYSVILPEKDELETVKFGTVTVNGVEVKNGTVTFDAKPDSVDVKSNLYQFTNITVDHSKKTITAGSAIPKVEWSAIEGPDSVQVGETPEYRIKTTRTWMGEIQCFVSENTAEKVEITNEIQSNSNEAQKVITLKNISGFEQGTSKTVTLTAKVGNLSISKQITVEKKTVSDFSIEVKANQKARAADTSWGKGVVVTITAPELKNEKVTVTGTGVEISNPVELNNEGTKEIELKLPKAGEYEFEVGFGGNSVYKPANARAEYSAAKEDQDSFELETGDQVEADKDAYTIKKKITYGDAKTEIATIKEITDYKDEIWRYSVIVEKSPADITENAEVEEGKVYFTPDQAGEYRITLKRDSDNYNEKALTFEITVGKKKINVKDDVKAENKTYDGKPDITVTGTLDETDLISKDKAEEQEDIDKLCKLSTTGKAKVSNDENAEDDVNAGEGKVVRYDAFTLKGSKLDKNYEIVNPKELVTTVTIEPKELSMRVTIDDKNINTDDEGNVKRAFDDLQNVDGLKVEVSGFVKTLLGEDENPEGYKPPKVIPNLGSKITTKAPGTTIENYFIADTSEANATDNYKFAGTSENLGLYITESSTGISDQSVSVDNSNSYNAYQENAGDVIYYKGSESTNYDEKTDAPKISFNIDNTKNPKAIYKKIFYATSSDKGNEVWNELKDNSYFPSIIDTGSELKLKLKTDDGGESDQFVLKLQSDSVMPKASINVGTVNTMYDFAGEVTFGNFKQKAFEAKIKVSDLGNKLGDAVSGIKSWSYKIEKLDSDQSYKEYQNRYKEADETNFDFNEFVPGKNTTGGTIRLGESSENDENGNFVVFVLVTDNVGNSKLYGSNGVVIDDVSLNSLSLNYKGLSADTKTKDNVTYLQNSAELYAIAEDQQSAVKKIKANITKTEETETEETETEIMFDLPKTEKTTREEEAISYTLADLKNYQRVNTNDTPEQEAKDVTRQNIKRSIGFNQCVEYTVSVEAEDMAGNPVKDPQDDEVTKTFVLDTINPTIENTVDKKRITYQNAEGMNYSNQDVTITTIVTERFIDESLIDLNLIKDGKAYGPEKPTLENWMKDQKKYGVTVTKEVNLSNSHTTSSIKITFTIHAEKNQEHKYVYRTSAKDYSHNLAGPSSVIALCLDQKKPDVKITYTPTNKDNQQEAALNPNSKSITYLGEDYKRFDVAIEIEENYFKKSDGTVLVTYGAGDNLISATNSSNKPIEEEGVLQAMAGSLTSFNTWKYKGISNYRFNHSYTTDANYTFPDFTVTDLAGNKTTVNGAKITLDKVRPTGTLTVANLVSGGTKGEISWNKLVSKLSFGLFGKNSVKVSMSSEDATAGLKSTQYIVTDTLKKRSELEAETKWKDYKKGNVLKLNKNRNYIVYEKVIDKAGNTDYFGTDRVVVDGNSPKPEVTITPSAPGWGKGVYSASDNPGFDILVTDPIENDSYAGLKSVTYTISGGANGYKESNTVTFTAKDHRQSYTGHVNIDPSRFYSNNVQVTVEAVDYSTNGASKQTEEIKIDNQAPKVSFSFDKSDAVGGKYYNKDKTLTITVDERNFDDSYKPEVTSSTNQGWSFSGWSSNGEKHTGTITFTGDADYTVSYFCYDKAGNKSNTEKLDEITIDKTKPTVAVSYDNNNAKNGSYYQEGRTATITITEHNFNASGVTVTTTANLDGGSVATPQASGWSSSGDTHTATISYPTDGDYTFTISITDMASNVSDPYATDSFTVDLTKPTIEISNIEDHSANKGTVAPVVTLNDTNFDRSNVNIQLTGVHKGVVNTANMYTTADTGKGQIITFANFGKNMDDIYTLKAETTDKAGNAYSTEIVFSVNRDGSTYQYNDYTEELLKKGYTNNPKDIVVSEINVDSLTLSELTLSKNGTVLTLKEGQDYDVQKSGGDVSWKEYVYTIHAANFEDEGDYTISIYSEDKAKNKTTNTSKAKHVEFIVDKTSPVISVANLQEGGHYKTDEQEFTANVDDNMALDKVEYYVDGELKESFDEKAVIEQNGALKLKVGSAAKFQEVSVKAYDKADNEPTIVTMNVLVSASGWVQFYNNKPLFFGTIILILLIVAGGVIIVMRVNRNGSLKMTTNRKEQRK